MKKLFYYTDVLPILSREDAAISKLKNNLETFKKASGEVRLVWHPYSQTLRYMELNKSPVMDDYLQILNDYRTEGWGELNDSPVMDEVKDVLRGCDAYYGDMSDLVFEAQTAGMPVMLQNIDVL